MGVGLKLAALGELFKSLTEIDMVAVQYREVGEALPTC
jgi:hypothetical protein